MMKNKINSKKNQVIREIENGCKIAYIFRTTLIEFVNDALKIYTHEEVSWWLDHKGIKYVLLPEHSISGGE